MQHLSPLPCIKMLGRKSPNKFWDYWGELKILDLPVVSAIGFKVDYKISKLTKHKMELCIAMI